MKLRLLQFVFLAASAPAFSQFNYLVNVSTGESTFIRDAVILNDESIVCALELEKEDISNSAVAQIDTDGKARWAKKIEIAESQEVFVYDVLKHGNGSYYVHGLTLIAYQQYAFILRISPEGNLENQTFFELGSSSFYGINKMKLAKDGDLICSFSHYRGVSFVRLNPRGSVVWGTTIARNIHGSHRGPGYDFQLTEDEGIIACGKNNYHFGLIKLSNNGDVIWDQDISMGTYSQAKTLQLLPDGDIFITGDYLPEPGFTSFIMRVNGVDGSPVWAKEIDQFDGSFHYQQTELLNDEIHLSMMGNNDPSKMDPDFQNYYVKINYDGEVLGAYRNGDLYDLADYQRLVRTDNGSIIYGSAYNEDRKIAGLVHSYKSQDFDMCYWSALELSTSPVSETAVLSFGANKVEAIRNTDSPDIQLTDIRLNSQGTCNQVWNESTDKEEENALRSSAGVENALVENHEFTVFPNPNDGIFTIRTTYEYVSTTVLDVSGKVIFEGKLENDQVIDLSGRPAGIYIMNIVTESESFIRRVQIR